MAKKKIPFGDVLDQALNAANLAVGLVPDPVGSPLKGALDIVTRIRQNFVRVEANQADLLSLAVYVVSIINQLAVDAKDGKIFPSDINVAVLDLNKTLQDLERITEEHKKDNWINAHFNSSKISEEITSMHKTLEMSMSRFKLIICVASHERIVQIQNVQTQEAVVMQEIRENLEAFKEWLHSQECSMNVSPLTTPVQAARGSPDSGPSTNADSVSPPSTMKPLPTPPKTRQEEELQGSDWISHMFDVDIDDLIKVITPCLDDGILRQHSITNRLTPDLIDVFKDDQVAAGVRAADFICTVAYSYDHDLRANLIAYMALQPSLCEHLKEIPPIDLHGLSEDSWFADTFRNCPFEYIVFQLQAYLPLITVTRKIMDHLAPRYQALLRNPTRSHESRIIVLLRLVEDYPSPKLKEDFVDWMKNNPKLKLLLNNAQPQSAPMS